MGVYFYGELMSGVLLVLQIILSLLIVVVVLLQKSASIGLGAYSGSNESLFGAKGPASFLAKLTMFLGFLFLANTISLGYFYNKEYNTSVLDNTKVAPLIPSVPNVPQNPLNNPLGNPLLQNAPKANPLKTTP